MIFITTPAGTVGSALVQRLTSLKVPFRAGYRSQAKADEAKSPLTETVVFEFEKPDTFATALRGVKELFLLSPPGLNDREAGVIDAAKAAGVKHIVKLSVWGADSDAFSFASHHLPMEKKLKNSGDAYTNLRSNGYMQNFISSHAPSSKNKSTFYLLAKDARLSFISAR